MKESHFKKTLSIKELLKGINYKCDPLLKECVIRGISLDSRNVSEGYLFFAVDGFSQNGNTFIDDALKNGAAVILSDKEHKNDKIIFIPNLRWHIGYIASRFYGDPSKVLETFPDTPSGRRELRQACQSVEDIKKSENMAKSTLSQIWVVCEAFELFEAS